MSEPFPGECELVCDVCYGEGESCSCYCHRPVPTKGEIERLLSGWEPSRTGSPVVEEMARRLKALDFLAENWEQDARKPLSPGVKALLIQVRRILEGLDR